MAAPRELLRQMFDAAIAAAQPALCLPGHILGESIEREARDVGRVIAGIALQVARLGQPFKPPCVLLSVGETTVTVRGQGRAVLIARDERK